MTRQIVPFLPVRDEWNVVGGYDPGHSSKNPAAWCLMAIDRRVGMPRLVAAHCAAEWPLQKWVPFFKRWHPDVLRRSLLQYGSAAELRMTFAERFQYRTEELELLAKISKTAHVKAVWHGDKYGENRESGTDSSYDILRRYGIDVQTHYRQERADEVRKAQDIWMPALLIEEDVAEHRAARPDGGLYHTPAECIVMAQMVSTEGHADPKYDISGKLPDRYVGLKGLG